MRHLLNKNDEKLLVLFALIWLLISCTQDKSNPTLRSAYYWSATWQMDNSKMNFIRIHHIKRLYVRYFDVVKDEAGNIMPNATIQFDTPSDTLLGTSSTSAETELKSPIPEDIEVIPVIYIVNECLRPASLSPTSSLQSSPTQLAKKILTRILQISEANDIPQAKEIQIDCDWTASTQQTYFDFLKVLREKAKAKGIQLSATIRLHQLSMTPPPVDRGILMMYNTGNAKDLKCQKPILDTKDVAPYIQHLADYPLPLAATYPLFKWRILFREGKFVGIMHADDDFPVLPSDSIVVRQPEMTDIMEAIKSINDSARSWEADFAAIAQKYLRISKQSSDRNLRYHSLYALASINIDPWYKIVYDANYNESTLLCPQSDQYQAMQEWSKFAKEYPQAVDNYTTKCDVLKEFEAKIRLIN